MGGGGGGWGDLNVTGVLLAIGACGGCCAAGLGGGNSGIRGGDA